GAASGTQRTCKNCAARPPLQRRVRQPCYGALYASALIPRQASHPIPASAPFSPALSLSGIPSSRCLSPQGCLTAKFSGCVSGNCRSVRTALHALRCNAWLGRFPSSYGLPSLLYHRSSSGSLAAPRPRLSALAPCSLYPLLPLYLLVFSSLSVP